jgi:hypothetical protein
VTVDQSDLVKKIVIARDTSTIPGASPTWLNIGEVLAYEGSRLLTSADFSEATLFPGIYERQGTPYPASSALDGNEKTFAHSDGIDLSVTSLTLVLKNPTRLTQVNVLNRQDCCWDRLEGASLILYDSADRVVLKKTLRGIRELQLFPVKA